MSFSARTTLISSLKVFSQPICARCMKQLLAPGCMKRLLPPASWAFTSTPQARQYTDKAGASFLNEMSTWQKWKWNIGLTGKLLVSKKKLMQSGFKLYICCSDFIDFSEFVRVVKLPDTFSAWFLLLQLHLWMVNVKVSQMGKEGALLKDSMYTAMWSDVERRLQTFKDLTGREKKKSLENYYSEMIYSTLYYDEGLIGSDKALANSLWVQLYNMDQNIQAEHLEMMVEYVRKQVCYHDRLDPEVIMKIGYISFLPLQGDKLNSQKAEQDFNKILDC